MSNDALEFFLRNAWLGFGELTGGTVCFGRWHITARVYCLGDPADKVRWISLQQKGADIGGGLKLNLFSPLAIFAHGLRDQSDFAFAQWAKFDWDVSLGQRWGSLLKSVKTAGKLADRYSKLRKIGEKIYKHRGLMQPGIHTFAIPSPWWSSLGLWAGSSAGEFSVWDVGVDDMTVEVDKETGRVRGWEPLPKL